MNSHALVGAAKLEGWASKFANTPLDGLLYSLRPCATPRCSKLGPCRPDAAARLLHNGFIGEAGRWGAGTSPDRLSAACAATGDLRGVLDRKAAAVPSARENRFATLDKEDDSDDDHPEEGEVASRSRDN